MASTTHVLADKIVHRIEPCLDQVLLRKVKETKSAGGIFLPANHNKNDVPTERGEVIAVGPGRYESGVMIPMHLKPGQSVMFQSYPAGCEIKENGEEYTLISSRQVACIINDE